jgi:predicted restriction endonuclease
MISRNVKQSKKGISETGEKCVVCGWSKLDSKNNSLLQGAHVKPLKGNYEIDNFNNIISLCPNHHIEFDAGNYYIDHEKKCVIHFNKDDEMHLSIVKGSIAHVKSEYFLYRKYLFEKKNVEM